ncbi:hypothetical protein [Pseudarthrobacter sp. SSS035]|uniref:hypothetical protein n=1 Tax=Pseudarthrobacter sp. SSS035 TaxID=2931399 RepID=UPI00200F278D|nr:hypothetical protein [Pseudarthrobacter sp. SSS035]
MNPAPQRLDFVGSNVANNLNKAVAYYQHMAENMTADEDPRVFMREAISAARTSLEKCLRGYDSFDALAFIRLAAGPWDFTDLRESESQIESSQAAQDVVALTLLGMGLPRQPLTGKNSGQPNPAEALGLAANIVTAARTLALFRGQRANQPLGALAGEFMGYELSVRGRQYESIAKEVNTELLGHPAVSSVINSVLGFTLDDIRAVREASTALMNERLFGARDRLGEASKAGPPADAESFRHDINLMMNECRLFGAVSPTDVAERSGVAESTARAVLDFFSTSRSAENDVNPVMRFVDGELPTPGGCIADEDEYLLLNGFLSEDELRRNLERGLIAAAAEKKNNAAKMWPKYDKRRAVYSESKSANLIGKLLQGAKPHWEGQKYIGPVDTKDTNSLGRDSDRTAVMTDKFESDILFLVDGVALCVEVKAASITEKSRGGNAQRLAKDLQKTLKEGNEQANRLTRLISTNGGVWSVEGEWIDLSSASEIHSIVVMLDDMGPLSLSMNVLADKGIIESDEVPWIVSMHDLIVISQTVDHSAQFLEYLRRRRGRRLATMVNGVDELDMFMWFLTGGMYFDPEPHEIAKHIPVESPIKASELRRYEEQPRVRLGTLTDPLDAWFYWQEGLSKSQVVKPARQEQPWVEQYLSASEATHPRGWLRFGADLVGLSESAQGSIGKNLKAVRRTARGGGIERSLTTHGASSFGSWLLTMSVAPKDASTDHLAEYMDAKQYQTHSDRAMLLLYQPDGSLIGTRYRGRPQERTTDRDHAVEIAPLRGLKMTFTKLPPSARRSTVRLRGARGKKKR